MSEIKTRPSNRQYREGWESVFKKGKGKHIRKGRGKI